MIRSYVLGGESLLIQCAETLVAKGHVVAGVVSAAPPIVDWATRRGLTVIAPGPGLRERLTEPVDYLFSITNLAVLPDDVLALPAKGTINFHDGPLPRYAGLYATAWALINGESSHGITWHMVSGGIDEGDVLLQRTFAISAGETSYSLNTKCYEAALESFPALVDQLAAGTATPLPQDPTKRSYFGRFDRPAHAGVLSWSQPAEALAALVRALDFGPVDNPLCAAKLWLGDRAFIVAAADVDADLSGPPGAVLAHGPDRVVVGTATSGLAITRVTALDGTEVPLSTLVDELGRAGASLAWPSATVLDVLTTTFADACRHESFWVRHLALADSLQLPGARAVEPGTPVQEQSIEVTLERGASDGPDAFVAAASAFLSRLCQRQTFSVGYRHAALAQRTANLAPVLASTVVAHFDLAPDQSFAQVRARVETALAALRARGTYAADVFARRARLRGRRPSIECVLDASGAAGDVVAPGGVVVAFDQTRGVIRWRFDAMAFDPSVMRGFAEGCAAFVAAALSDADQAIRSLPLVPEAQRRTMLEWNATAVEPRGPQTVPGMFALQAARTPDATAVSAGHEALTYLELDRRSNQLANYLRAAGVQSDTLVGVCLDRSVAMVIAILGITKAGGAYVPLDPTYPRDRIAFMLEDSGAEIVVSSTSIADRLGLEAAHLVLEDRDRAAIAATASSAPAATVEPAHLAYTLYTSGSTGRPKGVMVEHRNVANFFAGMDACLGTEPGVWLSVTSLSFDISVLEILWSLCRGFHLVLHGDRADAALTASAPMRQTRPLTFSLMFFASGEGRDESALDKYRLLIEAAKFGDANGFSAVWTPERHFYAFGGLYPNPSVVSAALATITSRIGLRAGSVVSPLHHPVRIAEEWALVDNLSNGRVGLSFAAGWQPVDFVLRPENFADRKAQMFRDLDTVRALWRGEPLTLQSPLGKPAEIRTLPRPIQPELPVWVTAAGNPETFVEAARAGAGVLTHLLGQTVQEVGEKVELYRRTWREAGHAGTGTVTVMLHTFVGRDDEVVRQTVRQPMKDYLRSAVGLIKAAAWTFPTFKQKADASGKTPAEIFESDDLSAEEMDALLDHAFERYYVTSGLFGTPDTCLAMVHQLQAIGVDDIACLLDYGVPSAQVLEQLPLLNGLRERIAGAAPDAAVAPAPSRTIAEQVAQLGVTHLQCTPSQLSLILATAADRAALASLQTICIGGEAFPPALAAELHAATRGRVLNMYGPTETTIWSSTYAVTGREDRMPIGRPIANTQLHVLDAHGQALPVGAVGELYIGGAGVARGYHRRPELTAERFVADGTGGGRLYRTGDLASWRPDGHMDFFGRADFQVKIRGYRIELGEIEAALRALNGVREAVVAAREDDPGDKRLVGYVTLVAGATFDAAAARSALEVQLPDYMVPSMLVVLEALPLTLNGKVDRKALPAPGRSERPRKVAFSSPESDLEQVIATVWRELLNVDDIGRDDNFFDVGGHSLLSVQAHRRLQQVTSLPMVLTDLFRFPTVRTLAAHLSRGADTSATDESARRGDRRRAGLMQRQRRRDAGPA